MRSARVGVDAGPDGTVGEDDGRRVVLQDGRHGADRGLVARHDAHDAGHAVGRDVHVGDVVDELAPDEGEAHLRRAVELAVGHAEGEHRRDQADGEVVVGDAPVQRGLNRLHLLGDTEIALAVAEVADDGPDGIVDFVDVLTEEGGGADPLHVAPGVDGHECGRQLLGLLRHGTKLAGRTCALARRAEIPGDDRGGEITSGGQWRPVENPSPVDTRNAGRSPGMAWGPALP